MIGHEMKNDKYWEERKKDRPCFWVPRNDLEEFVRDW